MTRKLPKFDLALRQEIVAAPVRRTCTDRTFGLPAALHLAFFGLFFAFLAVMWVGFGSPGLTVPMAICAIFTAAFFVVPMKWATMNPENASRAMSLRTLIDEGADTLNGRCSGTAAIAQVLILPALVLVWGIAVVTIAKLV